MNVLALALLPVVTEEIRDTSGSQPGFGAVQEKLRLLERDMAAAVAIFYLTCSTLQRGRRMTLSRWKDQVRAHRTHCHAVSPAQHWSGLCLATDGIYGVESLVCPS